MWKCGTDQSGVQYEVGQGRAGWFQQVSWPKPWGIEEATGETVSNSIDTLTVFKRSQLVTFWPLAAKGGSGSLACETLLLHTRILVGLHRELKTKTCRSLVVFDQIFVCSRTFTLKVGWMELVAFVSQLTSWMSQFSYHTHISMWAFRMGSKKSYGLMELNICTRRTRMNSFRFCLRLQLRLVDLFVDSFRKSGGQGSTVLIKDHQLLVRPRFDYDGEHQRKPSWPWCSPRPMDLFDPWFQDLLHHALGK